MGYSEITSPHNPLIRQIALLRKSPSPDRFLIEGARFAEELPPEEVLQVFVTDPEKHDAFLRRLSPQTPVYVLSRPAMDRICAAVSEQTITCVVCKRPVPRPDKLIFLDRVQDPGNVGTIIRTAYAFGFGVLFSPGCANPYAPKAIMSAAGALRSCYTEQVSDSVQTLRQLKQEGFSLCAAALRDDAVPPEELNLTPKRALIIGNEGSGISEPVLNEADQTVKIPMEHAFNSLNAAGAAAVLLYLMR